MASNCIHGFAPGTCLICQTLGVSPAPAVPARRGVTTTEPSGRARGSRRDPPARDATPELWAPPPDRAPAVSTSGRSVGRHLATLGLGVVAVVIAIWLLAGALFTILHVLELIAVAGGAGWVGYRIGWFRGRHQGRPQ